MKPKTALKAILGIGIAGLLFSGFLSYNELFGDTCATCTAGEYSEIGGVPVCVYGFVMYLLITGISAAGLIKSKKEEPEA